MEGKWLLKCRAAAVMRVLCRWGRLSRCCNKSEVEEEGRDAEVYCCCVSGKQVSHLPHRLARLVCKLTLRSCLPGVVGGLMVIVIGCEQRRDRRVQVFRAMRAIAKASIPG